MLLLGVVVGRRDHVIHVLNSKLLANEGVVQLFGLGFIKFTWRCLQDGTLKVLHKLRFPRWLRALWEGCTVLLLVLESSYYLFVHVLPQRAALVEFVGCHSKPGNVSLLKHADTVVCCQIEPGRFQLVRRKVVDLPFNAPLYEKLVVFNRSMVDPVGVYAIVSESLDHLEVKLYLEIVCAYLVCFETFTI